MSASSIFTPGYSQEHTIGTTAGTSVSNGEKSFSIDLPLELLTKEHLLQVSASQARTTAAATCDVRKVFKSITLNLSGGPNSGDRFSMSGHVADALSRITESQPSPNVDLANGLADFVIDVHHLLDGSPVDMISAIQMGNYTGAKLTFVLNSTEGQLFSGGTAAGNVEVTVKVKAKDYQSVLAMEHAEKIALFSHHCVGNSYNIVGTGEQIGIKIACGPRRNRFVIIYAFDSNGVPSDAIVGNLTFTVGSNKTDYTFKELRHSTVNKRGLNVVGCAVIDLGDNPVCFTPENVKEAVLGWTALAAGRIEVAPNWIEPLVA